MAKRFNFMKRVGDDVETFYPKTATDNVVVETSDGEIPLDDVLDNKGACLVYTEERALESTDKEILFDITEGQMTGEVIDTLKGTVMGTTEPEDTNYLWLDTSGEKGVLKFYNSDAEEWKPIKISSSDAELGEEIED